MVSLFKALFAISLMLLSILGLSGVIYAFKRAITNERLNQGRGSAIFVLGLIFFCVGSIALAGLYKFVGTITVYTILRVPLEIVLFLIMMASLSAVPYLVLIGSSYETLRGSYGRAGAIIFIGLAALGLFALGVLSFYWLASMHGAPL